MKKFLLTLMLSTGVLAASFHAQVKHWICPEKMVSKNISLNVQGDKVYKSPSYAKCLAKLDVQIIKIKGSQMEMLWENKYQEMELKKFPLTEGVTQKVHIPAFAENKEQIFVRYTITYKSKGSVLKVQNNQFLAKGAADQQVDIKI